MLFNLRLASSSMHLVARNLNCKYATKANGLQSVRNYLTQNHQIEVNFISRQLKNVKKSFHRIDLNGTDVDRKLSFFSSAANTFLPNKSNEFGASAVFECGWRRQQWQNNGKRSQIGRLLAVGMQRTGLCGSCFRWNCLL